MNFRTREQLIDYSLIACAIVGVILFVLAALQT